MTRIRAFVEGYYLRITNSIAFWPTLLSLVFVGLAIVLRQYSGKGLYEAFDEALPFLLVQDRDVSLSLLTTLIGGLISLMVFSFSMVMVLLNNATANLSPRLLPSLIGSSRHQIVLGFYLGTILFSIIIAMGFGLGTEGGQPPSVAVALAIVLGITCLALFVVFIHGVSRSIQVGYALADEHARCQQAIEDILARQPCPPVPDTLLEGPPKVSAARAGHLQSVDTKAIAAFAKTHDVLVAVDTIRGRHVLAGQPIMRYARRAADGSAEAATKLIDLPNDVTVDLAVMSNYSSFGLTQEYFGHGFNRITEVALKALSPGINDPGTALHAIDFLKHLFALALPLGEWEYVQDDTGTTRLWLMVESWSTLYDRTVQSLLTYGGADKQVIDRLQSMNEALAELIADGGTPAQQVSIRQAAALLRPDETRV